eukprot:321452-Chlamydomonas_euryale.AAC.1
MEQCMEHVCKQHVPLDSRPTLHTYHETKTAIARPAVVPLAARRIGSDARCAAPAGVAAEAEQQLAAAKRHYAGVA